ncbi:hypothetical protein [Collimonas sp.]|jgi:hypothetical protein|uniref:hypothetical protein n=1 Tax=Collimonas sp. TaxID=1963772 RepID=UPI002CD3FED2|nr:hypothetical protein [Collimonas sp.]HWW99812.1 hypothetical protein [Collimonas sp.]
MKLKNFGPTHWVSVALAWWMILPVIVALWLLFGNDIKAGLFDLFEKKPVVYSRVVVEIGESGQEFASKYKAMSIKMTEIPGRIITVSIGRLLPRGALP